jgi:RNA polymerase sigma-70 factor (ECF subfamily)
LNNGFLKIIKGLESVDHNNLNFYSWAKRIIVNSLIDDYRRNKNHAELIVTKDSESAIEFHATPTVNEADSRLSYNEIMGLLKTIPPISAHVFTLYVIDGYNHREIGELLEITEGTSKWHLSTARKLLRDRLQMIEQQTEKQFNL